MLGTPCLEGVAGTQPSSSGQYLCFVQYFPSLPEQECSNSTRTRGKSRSRCCPRYRVSLVVEFCEYCLVMIPYSERNTYLTMHCRQDWKPRQAAQYHAQHMPLHPLVSPFPCSRSYVFPKRKLGVESAVRTTTASWLHTTSTTMTSNTWRAAKSSRTGQKSICSQTLVRGRGYARARVNEFVQLIVASRSSVVGLDRTRPAVASSCWTCSAGDGVRGKNLARVRSLEVVVSEFVEDHVRTSRRT